MALKYRIAKLEDVAEPIREHYTDAPDGEGFVLDGIDDASTVKGALKKERDANKEAKQLTAAFKKRFPEKSVDEIAELVEEAQAAGDKAEKKGASPEEIQKAVEKRTRELNDELAAAKKLAEESSSELRTMRLDGGLQSIFDKVKVIPERRAAAMKLAKDHVTLDPDNPKRLVVLDEDGEVSTLAVEKFLSTKFKDSHPYLFEGSGASGSGSQHSRTPAKDAGQMSATDKIAAGLQQRQNG